MDKPTDFNEAEDRLTAAVARGECADYLTHNADLDKPECGANWGPDRTIRAEVIRWLILGPLDCPSVDPKGILIKGALIQGELDLSGITVAFPLKFIKCHFEKQIKLTGAKTKDLCLDGSYLSEGLRSYNLKTHGDVSLGNGFVAKGEVCLIRADIDGRLNCSNGKFETGPSPNKYALNAGGVVVKGHVLLNDGFSAKGEVRLPGAEIGGRLVCTGGSFENLPENLPDEPKRYALNAIDLKVDGTVFLDKGFDKGFHAKGEVRLPGADIGGQLDCTGGTFENPNGYALEASNLKIKSTVFLNKGFTAKGEVRLYWAELGDRLVCTGGSFDNHGGDALSADGIKVGGGVFLKAEVVDGKVVHHFTAKGEVRFNGADIGGRLNCSGGKFEKPEKREGRAFSASGIKVKADVFFRTDLESNEVFSAKGEVRLPGAEIGGHLDCTGGTFCNPGGIALRIENAKVVATLKLLKASICGHLNLIDAEVGQFSDDEASWPKPGGKLLLDGFKYGVLGEGSPYQKKDRKKWLALQHDKDKSYDFRPQPHEQLFQVLRRMGHEFDAREIGKEMQWEIRRQALQQPVRRHTDSRKTRGWWEKSWDAIWNNRLDVWLKVGWNWFLRATVGYGYRTARAFGLMLGFIFLGWLLFGWAGLNGDMRPSEEEVILHDSYTVKENKCVGPGWQMMELSPLPAFLTPEKWWSILIFSKESERVVCVPPDYPAFNAVIYSVDALLPIVDLRQEDYWMPRSTTCWGYWIERYLWLHIIVGWFLTTLAVAAFSGILKK